MKKTDYTAEQWIFSIYADDKKGLVGQLMTYFNRKSYDVDSLNVARTDISDLVLVTLEASVPQHELKPFAERLKKIVEVYTVNVIPAAEGLKKIGFYSMATATMDKLFWATLQKYGASLSSLYADTLVISKTGSDRDLQELYEQLEGPHLLGFCKSALIVEDCLVSFEEMS
jgi:acetolactate synthase small subunit